MSEADLIAERLALRGHRVTASRRRVLAAVLREPGHFTSDDIVRAAPRVGRATVFRTMRILLEAGVLCRVPFDDGSVRYRVSARGHHHHLVCVACGRVEDFTACDVAPLVARIARTTEYEIAGHRLELYGRCQQCRAGARQEAVVG
jgi:Fe2+ or Zn2+ uptake regulation protein